MTRDVLGAALIALVLVGLGIATHGGVPRADQDYLASYPSDSDIYLSMVSHHRMYPRPPLPDDPPWSMSWVRLPFRYRVLTPWLARLLPFGPVLSLALVNWTSLAGAYVFVLLTCRRVGVGFPASACALAVAYASVSHVTIYGLPFLTDGFILLVLSGMTYAFAVDNFWLFAALGLAGVFAREVPAVLLPVWCVRHVKRGLGVTAIAAIAVTILRLVLRDQIGGDVIALTPSGLWGAAVNLVVDGPSGASFWPGARWPANHLHGLVTDIEACWGWAFALMAMGLWLLPREAMTRVGPPFGALIIAAVGMSLIATDVAREFAVLLPVMVVAIAVVIAVLAGERRYVWLALLAGLAVAQFCLSQPTVVLSRETWAVWSLRVPIIKIGVAWAIGAAWLLRTDLTRRFTSPGYTLPHRAR
jgi:hypothetical protein